MVDLVGIVSTSFTVCFFFRASMTLTSLFYSSSLVVNDSVSAWQQNSAVNERPLQSPEIFCHLLMKFTPPFDVLQKKLSLHVLAVMLYFIYGVLNDTFIHIYSGDPLISSFFKLISWCLYLWVLILCIDLKSNQDLQAFDGVQLDSGPIHLQECVRFILQSIISIKCVVLLLNCKFKGNLFIIVHHSSSVAVDMVVVGWLLLSSDDLIKSFKTIDKLRNTLNKFPITVDQSSPSAFSWLTLVLHVVFNIIFNPMMNFGLEFLNFEAIISVSFLVCFFFRASMTLASLFYSSSLVVQDSVRAWRQNRDVSGRPFQSPEIFCHLLMNFSPLFDVLQNTLSVHVLAVMLYFNYGVLNDSFYHAYSKNPPVGNLVKTLSWFLYLGMVVMCIDLKSDQYERLSQEVFTSSVGHMSQRELTRVRLLISQCEEGSRKFAVKGFVTVVPQLCLVFFSFAIDNYILCEQNITFFRQLTGVTVVANSTYHC
ncbi:hypothetical protein J6590_054216 [Homalodisca vitripennis]|nr:hypothetical protein J6590_054216 [Homalodisca vitripennis]